MQKVKKLKGLSDEALAIYVRTQDKESYRELVRRYEKRLLRYGRHILKSRQDAEDAVQSAFIKAYINLNSFDRKKQFSGWIYRIVHNEAINLAAKKKKEVFVEEEVWEQIPDTDIKSLEEQFDSKHTVKKMQSCVTDLPLGYREPILLFYYEEKSYEEISDILHLPVNTVGTRISRGRFMLKKLFKQKK